MKINFCNVVYVMSFFLCCMANEDSTLTALYHNEKILCNSTEAINKIQKIPVNGPFGRDYRFKISCLPLNICNETCEWSDRCTEGEYGYGVFVGGIHSLYYNPTQERYVLLLCCNGSNENEMQHGPFENYEKDDFVIEAPKNQIVHQMFANHNTESKPWLEVQTRIYNSSVEDNCRSVPIERDASGVSYYASLSGLAGLAGLAGLVIGPGGLPPCCDFPGEHCPLTDPCLPGPGLFCDFGECAPV